MTSTTPEELAIYLAEIRGGMGGLEPLACQGASASYNYGECPTEDASHLGVIAARLPPGMVLLKFGSRSVVGSYTLPSGSEIVAKYYYPRSLIKHLSYGIGTSRCHQSWISGLALAKAGIPTPAPLLIAEWRHAGIWLTSSFLATRKAPGISLLDLVHSEPENGTRLEKIAAQLKEAFTLMARHRIIHGDMKATNIIVDPTNDDAISFIDLDATEVLLPPAKWATAWEKDRQRFAKNWNLLPTAAATFNDLFEVL